ncbi:MAG: hypothetical protein QM811_06605 [Pirellulales bacterium]
MLAPLVSPLDPRDELLEVLAGRATALDHAGMRPESLWPRTSLRRSPMRASIAGWKCRNWGAMAGTTSINFAGTWT